MFRTNLILLLICISSQLTAQIVDYRAATQGLFNKIEYHFNLQETDSIYALSSHVFRNSLSSESFHEVMKQQLYPLGRIQAAEMIEFDEKNNSGSFKLDFNTQKLLVILGIESEKQFSSLIFKPYIETVAQTEAPVQLELSKEAKAIVAFDKLIDSIGLQYTRKSNTHSLAIGILNNARMTSYFYGQVDPNDQRLADEGSVFEIGSITKTFTATLLAYLANEGMVDMESSILTYLPDSLHSNQALAAITLKMLANHTSGLPRLPGNLTEKASENPENPYQNYKEQDLMGFLQNAKTESEPGTAYNYSNLGYGLLGYILSQVTGKTYGEMIDDYISTPLNLSYLTDSVQTDMDLLSVHRADGQQTPVWEFDCMVGAGGLKTNISTMMSYVKAHFDLPETPTQQALAMTRQFTFFTPPDTDLGLGWHIQLVGENLIYWHNGGTGGSSSYLAFNPDVKKGIIVLSNTAESVDHIGIQLLNFLIDQK